jgi:CO/xanthine dehydrogenase Mo-binding subunit
VIGRKPDEIRIVVPPVGGAFGGKDGVTVQGFLALALLHSGGRPVRMQWEREESFLAGTKRHSACMWYRLGARADGTLHLLESRLLFDTGPYDHLGGVVLTLAMEHAGGPYRVPNVTVTGQAVYTNNPIGGAFRGFGVPQVTAVMEQVMDMLAARLEMDPLELRLKNALKRGDRNAAGTTVECSTGIIECLKELERHRLWKERARWKASAPTGKRRGAGVAALMQGSGYGPVVPDVAHAKVELTSAGHIRVYQGVVDMGQGNGSTSLQIAGALLCQSVDAMELVSPDTARTLPCGSASASRCTYTFGNALIGAAGILKERILQRAADLFMDEKSSFALVPGAVRHVKSGRETSLGDMAGALNESERTVVYRFRAPVAQAGTALSPDLGLHGMPHWLFSYGVQMALIEVDEGTGEVEVAHYLAVSDCGALMNPQALAGQVEGALAQGLGYALLEEYMVKEGKGLTGDLATYLIPTAPDVPELQRIEIQLHEPTGPFGLKGAGELAINGPLPAVANALYDACAIRISMAPLKGERVLKAMREGRGER